MDEVLFFSNNKNKIIEVSVFFENQSIKLLSLNDYESIKSPSETGLTFKENAKIKSLYGYKHFKKICFADDSGICISALKGKPGINSKKLLASKKNPKDVLKEIVNNVVKTNDYKAHFQTSICLTISQTEHIFFEGTVRGKISKKIKGSMGFGYDPIFIPDGEKNTFAEMDINEKNLKSHRAIAIQKLKKYILKNF